MRPRQNVPPEVVHLAHLQAGVLARPQVAPHLHDSVIARLVRDGQWHRMAAGVYSLTPPPHGFETLAWGGVLAAGPMAMLGGHAAGHLQGLVARPPDEVLVLVGQTNHVRLGDPWRVQRRRSLPRSRHLLPRTPPEWTVLDLCDEEPHRAVEWVTSALRQRLVSPRSLRAALEERPRICRTPIATRDLLRQMLDDAEGLESPLEHLYATRVEAAHGLPRGIRQVRSGRTRQDVRYDGLVVELDGRLGHAEAASGFRDMARDNAASLEGLFTHRYGYDDCSLHPCETARQVAVKLRQLGWSGSPHPCRDCRNSDLWRAFLVGLR